MIIKLRRNSLVDLNLKDREHQKRLLLGTPMIDQQIERKIRIFKKKQPESTTKLDQGQGIQIPPISPLINFENDFINTQIKLNEVKTRQICNSSLYSPDAAHSIQIKSLQNIPKKHTEGDLEFSHYNCVPENKSPKEENQPIQNRLHCSKSFYEPSPDKIIPKSTNKLPPRINLDQKFKFFQTALLNQSQIDPQQPIKPSKKQTPLLSRKRIDSVDLDAFKPSHLPKQRIYRFKQQIIQEVNQ